MGKQVASGQFQLYLKVEEIAKEARYTQRGSSILKTDTQMKNGSPLQVVLRVSDEVGYIVGIRLICLGEHRSK
jgi:hypothetical protein